MDQHLREKTELDEPTKVSGAEEANEMFMGANARERFS